MDKPMARGYAGVADTKHRRQKFDYEEMKQGATSPDTAVRKKIFIEYFERFEEFPSYLFDNESRIHPLLKETMNDIQQDPATTKRMHEGVEALLLRLPS